MTQFIIAVGVGNLVAILTIGYKIFRAITEIEIKVQMMWSVFEDKMERRKP